MITIIQKSKRSSKRNEFELSVNEAKEYLYEIDARSFRINYFLVYRSDDSEELTQLVEYFNPEYLIEEVEEKFTIYKVNEKVGKYDRMRTAGASIKAINNFREKIQKELQDSEVSIIFEKDTFDILIQHPNRDLKIVCSYQLEIIRSLVLNHEWEFVDINENDLTVNFVNKLFRKQRYYYKQKDGN